MTVLAGIEQKQKVERLPTTNLTYRDLDALPDFMQRYELWEGMLIVAPAPTFNHQATVMNLLQVFTLYDPDYQKGRYVPAPVDVVLAENVVFQPDVVFLTRANLGLVKEGRIIGAPDLCVEILSPSTAAFDLTRKRGYYQQAGVREYWLVDPFGKTLTVYALAAGEKTEYESGQVAVSTLPELAGLRVELARLFATP